MLKFLNNNAPALGVIVNTLLFIVTTATVVLLIFYTRATITMRRFMREEFILKTKAHLLFNPIVKSCNGFEHYSIKQEILNIGLSIVVIESMKLICNPKVGDSRPYILQSKSALQPIFLKSGDTYSAIFDFDKSYLDCLDKEHYNYSHEILICKIEYTYRGLDNIQKSVMLDI